MTSLMQAIMAQLPRVTDEGDNSYKTAYGLKTDYDAHPLVAQADLKTLSQNLGVLYRQGLIEKFPYGRDRSHRRGSGTSYAVRVPDPPTS